MLVTDSVGALYRTLLESLRMLSVWVLDLLLFYGLDGQDRRCATQARACCGSGGGAARWWHLAWGAVRV